MPRGRCSPSDVEVAQNIAFGIIAAVMIVGGDPRRHHQQRRARRAVRWWSCWPASAAQYLLLAAEFVAVTQILVYIGAVIVLFLFGIMLTRAPIGRDARPRQRAALGIGVAVALVLLGVLAYVLIDGFARADARPSTVAGPDHGAGHRLDLRDLPGAVRGRCRSLLLAALIGAIVLARKD